jgi:hypothetical protein
VFSLLAAFTADQLKSMTKSDLEVLFAHYDRYLPVVHPPIYSNANIMLVYDPWHVVMRWYSDGRGYLKRGSAGLTLLGNDVINRILNMYADAVRANKPSLSDDDVNVYTLTSFHFRFYSLYILIHDVVGGDS